MMAFKYIAFISALLILSQSKAQDKIMNYSAEVNYHYGFILAHRNDLKVLAKGYTTMTEFSFAKQTIGKKDWEVKYNYPYAGLSLMFFDFSNPEQLGQGISLFTFLNFPILRKKDFEFNFKLGFGCGYIEKVFNTQDNYKNFAVSTNYNGFVHGNLHMRYTFANHIMASAGISISHFSNASASKPNLGINAPALNAGLAYKFGEKDKITRESSYNYEFNKTWDKDFVASIGRRRESIGGEAFGVFSLAYSQTKHVSYKSKLGGGADFFYNTSHQDYEYSEGETINTFAEMMQLGVNFSYTLQISDLSIFISQGVYVYSKYKENGSMYNRAGLRYIIDDHFIMNVSLKTHFAVADHVEFGIGYRL